MIEMKKLTTRRDEPEWYQIAKKELGVIERPGKKHNKRIVEYHSGTSLRAKDDETPWCSSFVDWCMKQAGIKGTSSAGARSWLKWGDVIEEPILGCVVIFTRGQGAGHVGFYAGESDDYILVLGGNQSNKVCYSKYPKSRLLGYRWPEGWA